MARPKQQLADIPELQQLVARDGLVNLQPVIAYVMYHCGATYSEIGQVFGVSPQAAMKIVENAESEL